MSKARTPAVPITFGGKRRNLIYDFNAMAELEDLAGTFSSSAPKLKAMRAAVWAGLLAETLDRDGRPTDQTLSVVEVGEILNDMEPADVEQIADAILEAKGISKPPEEDRPTPADESPSQ